MGYGSVMAPGSTSPESAKYGQSSLALIFGPLVVTLGDLKRAGILGDGSLP
jgi:hypothetical protein